MSVSLISTTTNEPNYLVVIDEVLIARDIALTITDQEPEASVLIASSLTEAEEALSKVSNLVLAFVNVRPRTFAESALAQAISKRGGRVVLLGYEAEAVGPNPLWDVLMQPFDTAAVLARLNRRSA